MAKIELNGQEYKGVKVGKESFRVNGERLPLDLAIDAEFPESSSVAITFENTNPITVDVEYFIYVSDSDGGTTEANGHKTLHPNGTFDRTVETENGRAISSVKVETHMIATDSKDEAYYKPTSKEAYF